MATKTIKTPDLGGASEVTVIEVLVNVGDKIDVDTPVVTLESDKATMDVPTTDAGIVKEIKVKTGDTISSGDDLLVIDAAGDKADDSTAKAEPEKAAKNEEAKSASVKAEKSSEKMVQQVSAEPASDADVHAGPGVRRLAHELSINLAVIGGSGPKKRVTKDDVLSFYRNQVLQQGGGSAMPPAPVIDFSKFGPVETKALSRIKKLSGKNLVRNWATIPHVTQFADADITELEAFRQAQKGELEKQNVKLTPLVFIMKAVVKALKAFPHFNASLDNTGENLIMKNYFHIGVAVDTPDGLVVPVIRDVEKKGVTELARELAEVSEKARNKKLMPGDMQGGCFSISSLGGIGGTAFTPIINAPEVAILGVSKTMYKPVYQDGEFVPRLMLPLSLSYDHRVIDGADGARFIMHLTNMLSDIRNLLL